MATTVILTCMWKFETMHVLCCLILILPIYVPRYHIKSLHIHVLSILLLLQSYTFMQSGVLEAYKILYPFHKDIADIKSCLCKKQWQKLGYSIQELVAKGKEVANLAKCVGNPC